MYTHSFISSESDAATKYADSWITSYEGDHISYVHCAEGAEYSMFFGTDTRDMKRFDTLVQSISLNLKT